MNENRVKETLTEELQGESTADLLKKDIILPEPQSGGVQIPILQSLQVLFAFLLLLIGLKYSFPKILSYFNANLSANLESGIKIEESVNFATGKLYIVTARDKTLLLSATPAGVSCLAELGEDPFGSDEAFLDVLDSSKGFDVNTRDSGETITKKDVALVEAADTKVQSANDNKSDTTESPKKREDIQAVLDRLKKLTGDRNRGANGSERTHFN